MALKWGHKAAIVGDHFTSRPGSPAALGEMDMKPNDTPQDGVNQNRRGFLKTGAASLAAGVSAGVIASRASGEVMSNENSPAAAKAIQDMMPTRNLGKTGFRVGIFGLGGQGALEKANNESLALQMIQRTLDLGVNYFDTSAIYGGPDRWSERYLGKGLKGRRDHVFIATKTKERTRDAALKNLEVSLKLLDTDHIDTWQLHDVGIQEDIDQIFGKLSNNSVCLRNDEFGGLWDLSIRTNQWGS